MKLENYISNTIKRWPDLFGRSSYEESRLPVLNHTFFSYGTGLEWCKGGFLAEHLRGRKADKRNFHIYNEMAQFDSDFFIKCGKDHSDWIDLISSAGYCYKSYGKENPTGLCEYSPVVEMINGRTNSPHIENFELTKILPDWIDGAREMVEYARTYYRNYDLYKHHVYYKNEESWSNYVKRQNEYFDKFSEKFPKPT